MGAPARKSPVANRLRGRFMGLDFGQQALDCVWVELQPGKVKLLAAQSVRIAPSQNIIDVIHQFRKRYGISSKEVLVSLTDSEEMLVKQLSLPALGMEESLNAGRWQLKNDAVFPLEQARMDCQVVDEESGADGTVKRLVTFAAAKKEAVDFCLAILRQCRLKPLVLTNGVFNYGHILHAISAPEISAVLEIDCKETVLAIYVGHRLHFLRRMPISADKFTQALMEPLVTEKGKIRLTAEQAEAVKNRYGIPLDQAPAMEEDIQPNHVIALIRPLLESLVRELRFSLSFFRSNAGQEKPFALYITGEGANLKNFPLYLEKELGCPIQSLPIPSSVEVKAADFSPQVQNRIMSPLGAVLGGLDTMNLLPPEARVKQTALIGRSLFRIGFVITACVLAFAVFMARVQMEDYSQRLNSARMHLQTVSAVNEVRAKIGAAENLMDKIYFDRVPVEGLLKVIRAAVPEPVTLNDLVFDQSGRELILKGTVTASEETAETILIDFMQKLEASNFLAESSLGNSNRTGGLQRFEIRCHLAREK